MALPLAGIGSALLGGLGSLFGGGGGGLDEKAIRRLQELLSSGAILGDANQLFQGMTSSPYGRYALTQANLRGAQAGQSLRRSAALAGGSTSSPFAALARAGASVTQGIGRQETLSSFFEQALNAALANRRTIAGAAAGLPAPKSGLGSALGTIGQTLGDFALLQALNDRNPSYDLLNAAPSGPGYGFQPPAGGSRVPTNRLAPRP